MKVAAFLFASLTTTLVATTTLGASGAYVPPTPEALRLCQRLRTSAQDCEEYKASCSGSKIDLPKKADSTFSESLCSSTNGRITSAMCVVVPISKNGTAAANGCYEGTLTAEEIGEGGICCSGVNFFIIGTDGPSSSADSSSGTTGSTAAPSEGGASSSPTTTAAALKGSTSGAIASSEASVMMLSAIGSSLMATALYASA